MAKEETDGEPASKKAKVADDEETKMVKNTMEFVSLEKALAADWTTGMKSRFKVSIEDILRKVRYKKDPKCHAFG